MPVDTDDLRAAIPSLYPDNLNGEIDAARMRQGQTLIADVIDEAIGKAYSDEAKAWAQSATPPDPLDLTSKSAKTWAAATAADRVQTGLDRTQTGLDRTQTGLDRVQTGLDRTAAAASAAAAAGAISGTPIYDSVLVTPAGSYTLQPPADYDIALKTTGDGSVKIDAAIGLSFLAKAAIGPDYGGQTTTISSGTYVSATGVITLTLAANIGIGVGGSVRLSALAGAGCSPKLNGRYVAQTGTTGTTLVLAGATGLGAGTFSGGTITLYEMGGQAYRQPTEGMKYNFMNYRQGGYNFEDDKASWLMQLLPNGVNIGSPNDASATPLNALEVGGGTAGKPNEFFANVVIGRDWARTQVAPDSSLTIQGSLLVGNPSILKQTSTIASATYNSTTGLVTVTLAASVGLSGFQHFTISGAAGTGSFALLNGTHVSYTAGGTALTFYLATGLTMTISGGTITGAPSLRASVSGASWGNLVGAGGAQFLATQPVEAHISTGAAPATSGTTSNAPLRVKADTSAAVLDFGINGGSGGWIVATNNAALGTRYPIILGDGGKVAIGSSTAGATNLRVSGLPVYADNTAALAGGLTAGDVYRTATGAMMVVF